MPLQDSRLPVQRQMIEMFADSHVRQQTWTGKALGERLLGLRRGHHTITAFRTGILRSNVLDHEQARGHVFELLADVLADLRPRRLAAGAELLHSSEIVFAADARQIRRQAMPLMTSDRSGVRLPLQQLGGQFVRRRCCG